MRTLKFTLNCSALFRNGLIMTMMEVEKLWENYQFNKYIFRLPWRFRLHLHQLIQVASDQIDKDSLSIQFISDVSMDVIDIIYQVMWCQHLSSSRVKSVLLLIDIHPFIINIVTRILLTVPVILYFLKTTRRKIRRRVASNHCYYLFMDDIICKDRTKFLFKFLNSATSPSATQFLL